MIRAIDHLVLPVRDLDAARDLYVRMGFTLTPVARHPWGTANSLVQMGASFLELLAVADPASIAEPAPGGFSFGAFNRDFLNRREGFSMLVFRSADARRDQAEYAAAGVGAYPVFDFARQARLPDGSEVEVSFSLAFATDPRLPEAAFFTCQQHAPQYFWKPAYQTHANTARDAVEAVLVADDPADLGGFLGTVAASAPVGADGGIRVPLDDGGAITVLTPKAYAARFPGLPLDPAFRPPAFAAFTVAVADLDKTRRALETGGVPFFEVEGRLQVGPGTAFGVAIEFRAAQAS